MMGVDGRHDVMNSATCSPKMNVLPEPRKQVNTVRWLWANLLTHS